MRTARLLSAAIIATTGLVAVGASTEAANAASSKDLLVTHAHVMKSEVFGAYGQVSTHNARKVKLQYRNSTHGPWTTKYTEMSNSSGNFEFGPSTSKTRYFRFYAPANGSSEKIVGNARKVTVVSQSVKFFAVTPTFQCSNFGPGNVTMFAQFYPVRPGRSVSFATNTGTIGTFEDDNGNATVNFAAGSSPFAPFGATATAMAFSGAGSKASAAINYSQEYCDV